MSLRGRVERIMRGGEKPGLLRAPLAATELAYATGVSLRNRLYDSGLLKPRKAPCKVISVGNITVGGSGKTPFVELLAKKLADKKPGVLSRGYGARFSGKVFTVSDGKSLSAPPPVCADEPYMLAKKLAGVPVVLAPRRYDGATELVRRFGVRTIILDDGFQHRSLYRDMDILLLDADSAFGNGSLTPLGILREPAWEARRADIIVITSGGKLDDGRFEELKETALYCAGPGKHVVSAEGAVTGFVNISGAPSPAPAGKAMVFCGIAGPERFLRSLRGIGINVGEAALFADHHNYSREDYGMILEKSRETGADSIITTEKDGVRLLEAPGELKEKLLLAVYEMRMTRGEQALDNAISYLY